MQSPPVKRAIISVSDKLGLAGFARGLVEAGVEIFSTGGTGGTWKVRELQSPTCRPTGFPEMMDGRLKTLHPMIHGGILCRRDNSTDMAAVAEFGIKTFELVVVNLYPFEQTVAARMSRKTRRSRTSTSAGRPWSGPPRRITCSRQSRPAPANIPRSSRRSPPTAARRSNSEKARRRGLRPHGPIRRGDRRVLRRPEGRRARSQGILPSPSRARACSATEKIPTSRQPLYAAANAPAANLVSAMRLNGKELSYNNLLDLDSALAIVRSFSEPAASVIKHNNPCGAPSAHPCRSPGKRFAGRSAPRPDRSWG